MVEVGGHRAPAREERIGLLGASRRLVGGDVEQGDLGPVHRVDVEGAEVGVQEGPIRAERLVQRGVRDRVVVRVGLRQAPAERVELPAPRVARVRGFVVEAVVEAAIAERVANTG